MPLTRHFFRNKGGSIGTLVMANIPITSKLHPQPYQQSAADTHSEEHNKSSPHVCRPHTVPREIATPPITPPITHNYPSPHFTLLAHHQPASWTIAVILEELGLTYSVVPVGLPGTSDNPADFLGPNEGHLPVPALVDHSNKDLILLETGAIVMYLVEKYGVRSGKGPGLCPENDEEKAAARQWLFFSITGHAMSFSQACHFLYDHPQKLPTAITYTTTMIHHALNTLNTALSSSPTGYLVPTREGPTYADLVFWSWNWVYESGGFPALVDGSEQDCWKRYPHVGEWQYKMDRRLNVQKVVEKWEQLKLEYV